MERPQTHEGTERLRSSSASSSSSSTRSSEFEDPSPFEGRISSKDDGNIEEQDDESAVQIQSPRVETMERPPDGSLGYRIPSHVFARKKSGPPMDWRSVSNESLFSIRMDDTSFTGREQYNSWLIKSGELSSTPEVSSPSMDDDLDPFDHGQTIPEEGEVKTKTKTSGSRRDRPDSMGDHQQTPMSSHSNASGQSFAFPVLEGELDRGGSTVKSEPQKKPSSDANEAHSQAQGATNAFSCSWFSSCVSYFSCCTKARKDATG